MTYKHTRSATSMPVLQVRATALAIDEANLPDGICGRVTGIAVRYDVIDSYGTIFRRGSLDRTRSKVNAGKVKLFVNHGMGDMYGTSTHVGVVRSLNVVEDGEYMVADLFDTEDGRKQKEYLRAVMASGAETGLSIGFFERAGGWESVNGKQVYSFSEIELDEISLAPRQAVPGATVSGVRAGLTMEMRRTLAQQIAAGLTRAQWDTLVADVAPPIADEASAPQDQQEPNDGEDDSQQAAQMAARVAAFRRTFISA